MRNVIVEEQIAKARTIAELKGDTERAGSSRARP
jgi:hypothetical protein